VKLYTFPMSNNCMKVVAVMNQLGLAAESEFIDLAKGGQMDAGFVKLNPNHMVPTLADGDFALWESNAIMQYLCSRKPGTSLYPTDPKVQADINRWMFWQSGHLNAAVGVIQFERMVKGMMGMGDPNPALVDPALERFHRFAAVLDGHLSGREWIVGREPTLADFSVGSSFIYAVPSQLPMEKYAEVRRWYGKLAALPAWADAMPSGG
jgi:glutathione S-transferase